MKVILGDCLEVLKKLEDNSVDAVVTDPPYGLKFMNKGWDYEVPSIEIWSQVLRVLKPGGHLLSFGGTRTYHRMVVNIEDAGFEIRDQIQWIYGSGFPKSLDISKAIDKAASTDLAKQWQGFGTALKPANEPIVLARKPLSEKTVAANVLKWGTGGLNIDASRIATNRDKEREYDKEPLSGITGHKSSSSFSSPQPRNDAWLSQGRFPANLLLDEMAAQMLDEQSGQVRSAGAKTITTQTKSNTDLKFMGTAIGIPGVNNYSDSGGASRFFYVAKASKRERNQGLAADPQTTERTNNHPTVKPIKLMEYLCRLMGSGTTGLAAKRLGFQFIGIEKEEQYFEIAKQRVNVRHVLSPCVILTKLL